MIPKGRQAMFRKLIFFFVSILIAGFLVMWFSDHPGTVHMRWLGYDIQTNIVLTLLGLATLFVVLGMIGGTIKGILSFPSFLRGKYGAYNQQRGMQALYRCLTALGAQDIKSVLAEADHLQNFWRAKPLADFFRAEAAFIGGDEKKAEQYFQTLARGKETEFLGLSGLIHIAKRQGQKHKVLRYATEAQKFYKDSPFLLKLVVEYSLTLQKFEQALMALDHLKRLQVISIEKAEEEKALILVAEAKKFESEGKMGEADKLYEDAFHLRYDLLPVALAYLPKLIARDKKKKARRFIEEIWPNTPHPDLIPHYLKTFDDSLPMDQFKHVQRLASFSPEHPQSLLESARYALKAKVWGRARSFLHEMISKNFESVEVYTLLAQLEIEEHQDKAKAAVWHNKALSAPKHSTWRCESCQKPQDNWLGSCPDCWAWGRIRWIGVNY